MIGMGDEILAIAAGTVREIIDPLPFTRVVGAKPFVRGVMNVRGNIIPLADLRSRFGMACRPTGDDTRIGVVEAIIHNDPVIVGIIADRVYEVAELAKSSTRSTPRLGMRCKPDYIRIIAKWNDDFIIAPNLERVLNCPTCLHRGISNATEH